VLWDSLHLTGVGSYLPASVSAAEAALDGRYDPQDHLENEYISACEAADGESAPEMAVHAVRDALSHTPEDPADIDLVLYAHVYHQGHDIWSPSCYVQREVIGNKAPCMQVMQASNGGMAALELAASHLVAHKEHRNALVVAADRYSLPGFDRWRADFGQVYGDGAAALVLSNRGGFARLVATHSTSDPELEDFTRGAEKFTSMPLGAHRRIDLRKPKKEFLHRSDFKVVLDRMVSGLVENVDTIICQAGLTMAEVDWVVIPHSGREMIEWQFLEPLGIPLERTTWEWGRHICHLGAGDQIAGLWHLDRAGKLRHGQRVLLIGVGVGLNWTSAILEICAPERRRA
jgi:3-oxoacyl-[acyl-carrier-protein] synthase III